MLWANYFELAPSRNLVVHRYNIDVQPDEQGRRPIGGKLKRIFELLIAEHFTELQRNMATDYKSIILCKSELTITQQPLSVGYRPENQDGPQANLPTYQVRLNYTGTLSVAHLMDHLTSMNVSSIYSSKEEMIQALNIILGNHPKSSSSILSVGANRHFAMDQAYAEKWNLGAGLEALRGYFVSVRAAASRILVNVQVKHAACYDAAPLDRLMISYRDANGPNLYKLESFLKGLRVNVIHITRRNRAGQAIPRVKTITGLATSHDGQGLPHPPRVTNFGAGSKDVQFFLGSGPSGAPKEETSDKPSGSGSKKGKKSGAPSGKKPGSDPSGDGYISVFDFFRRRKYLLRYYFSISPSLT